MQNTPVSASCPQSCSCLLSLILPLSSIRLHLFSRLPPVPLFLPTLPIVSPSPCSSVMLPRLFYLPQSFYLPICFLFSAVSQHSLVLFFFLRSHFRTSEGDQEKMGLQKPAVRGSSSLFALQIAVQHSETFRPSSSLSEKQVVSRSTCLVSPFDASTPE